MILVVGATGYLGGEICRRLTAKGQSVRGLIRATSDPSTTSRLRDLGVATVVGDLRDRRSLDAACKGASTVISTVTTTRSRQPGDSIETTDRDGQLTLIDAARAAGVKHFVYLSYSGNISSDDPLTVAKRTVEKRLRESGMTYTILRPTYFMEFWLSPAFGFDYGTGKATIYGSGDNKLSWISLGDVAEFAVRSLDEPSARNATIELGGPEALSQRDAVKVFEEKSGRRFELQSVPENAIVAQRNAATDSLQQAFAALTLALARGDAIPMRETLTRFPVRLTSVRDYAQRVLAS